MVQQLAFQNSRHIPTVSSRLQILISLHKKSPYSKISPWDTLPHDKMLLKTDFSHSFIVSFKNICQLWIRNSDETVMATQTYAGSTPLWIDNRFVLDIMATSLLTIVCHNTDTDLLLLARYCLHQVKKLTTVKTEKHRTLLTAVKLQVTVEHILHLNEKRLAVEYKLQWNCLRKSSIIYTWLKVGLLWNTSYHEIVSEHHLLSLPDWKSACCGVGNNVLHGGMLQSWSRRSS